MATDDKALEEGMTYVERLDFRAQEHRHAIELQAARDTEETKRAKYNLRKERQNTYQVVSLGFFVLILLLAVITWIYFSTSGDPSPGPDTEMQREVACVDNGGVWIPDDLLTSGEPLCVYPGKNIQELASE